MHLQKQYAHASKSKQAYRPKKVGVECEQAVAQESGSAGS